MTIITIIQSPPASHHLDDIVVWPDGTWASLGEVRNGEYTFVSDDYEIVRLEDHRRLKALGLDIELEIA